VYLTTYYSAVLLCCIVLLLLLFVHLAFLSSFSGFSEYCANNNPLRIDDDNTTKTTGTQLGIKQV